MPTCPDIHAKRHNQVPLRTVTLNRVHRAPPPIVYCSKASAHRLLQGAVASSGVEPGPPSPQGII